MQFSDLSAYDYLLPPELIRKEGVEPRDSARLFVYDTATDTVSFDIFHSLAQYLPESACLVLNTTRVLPVRLWLTKETGGKIEVFVLVNQLVSAGHIPVLVDRKVSIGQKLLFPGGDFLEVVDQDEEIFFVRVMSTSGADLYSLLALYGQTPLPHYLEGASVDEEILRKRYQTIFAEEGASVAAPTAGLHFTESVLNSLIIKKIHTVSVTLDVGRGTFAPLAPVHFTTKSLHTERIALSSKGAQELNQAKEDGKAIIAVGTTALRTLESTCHEGRFVSYTGNTSIFIFPPHHFQSADILITNFHLPKTSLLLLVDAFLKSKGARRNIMDLYHIAIENRFSFYSFGDSMLIL